MTTLAERLAAKRAAKESTQPQVSTITSSELSRPAPVNTPSKPKTEVPSSLLGKMRSANLGSKTLTKTPVPTKTETPRPSVTAQLGASARDALLAKLREKQLGKVTEKVEQAKAPSVPPKSAASILQSHREKMEAAAAKIRERQQSPVVPKAGSVTLELPKVVGTVVESSAPPEVKQKHQVNFDELNEDQRQAPALALEGKSFVLIGSAGSGKTTTVRVTGQALAEADKLTPITTANETKYMKAGMKAMAVVSFTNQAVNNIASAMPAMFKPNCVTCHKLLEYIPQDYEYEVDGEIKKSMRYVPDRTSANPIPQMDLIVIEEAGNVNLELYDQLRAALPANVTEILLGDLNQLPPVFGDAILGYKLLEYPVVELKRIYRQSTDSAIKQFSYKLLEGRPLKDSQLKELEKKKELEFFAFKIRKDAGDALPDAGQHFQSLVHNYFDRVDKGEVKSDNPLDEFNYLEDVVLLPYGKSFGSFEIAKYIAQAVGERLGSPVFEIFAGLNKKYFAVGDIVFYNKIRCKITDIQPNKKYVGALPQPASMSLDRWGINADLVEKATLLEAQKQKSLEEIFETISESEGEENDSPFRSSSHVITLESLDAEEPAKWEVSATGAVSDIQFTYALTVHKSQGSEWGKIFCVFHHSHATMLQRELLYTAITRARNHLRVYYSGDNPKKPGDSVFYRGIMNQRIPGNTLEQKLKYFKDKLIAEALTQETTEARLQNRTPNISKVLQTDVAVLAQNMLEMLRAKKERELSKLIK